jgi:hypothetical protein
VVWDEFLELLRLHLLLNNINSKLKTECVRKC